MDAGIKEEAVLESIAAKIAVLTGKTVPGIIQHAHEIRVATGHSAIAILEGQLREVTERSIRAFAADPDEPGYQVQPSTAWTEDGNVDTYIVGRFVDGRFRVRGSYVQPSTAFERCRHFNAHA